MKTEYYHNHLPHFHHAGATFFVTWMLFDAVPKPLLKKLKEERKATIQKIERENPPDLKYQIYMAERHYFYEIEELLHKMDNQSNFLKMPEVAAILQKKLHEFDDKFYRLITYTIMSNHVHAIFDFSIQLPTDGRSVNPAEYVSLSKAMNLILGASSFEINRLLGCSGSFWMGGYMDRYIRNQKHLRSAIEYTLLNPVKAGLVQEWEDHPFTWLHP